MTDLSEIREHMPVLDAEGTPIGTVDGIEDGRIKLTRESSPDGEHRYIEADDVESVDEDGVMLTEGAMPFSDFDDEDMDEEDDVQELTGTTSDGSYGGTVDDEDEDEGAISVGTGGGMGGGSRTGGM